MPPGRHVQIGVDVKVKSLSLIDGKRPGSTVLTGGSVSAFVSGSEDR